MVLGKKESPVVVGPAPKSAPTIPRTKSHLDRRGKAVFTPSTVSYGPIEGNHKGLLTNCGRSGKATTRTYLPVRRPEKGSWKRTTRGYLPVRSQGLGGSTTLGRRGFGSRSRFPLPSSTWATVKGRL